jgi:two-component system, cell cycle sensor histidine kinase and response regulator CckA
MEKDSASFLPPISGRVAAVVAALLTLIEVFIDWVTPVELNVAIVYGLPLVVIAATRSRRLLWALMVFLVLTTFAVYAVQIPSGVFSPHQPLFVNRVLAALALALTTCLLHVGLIGVDILEAQWRSLKENNEELERRRRADHQESAQRLREQAALLNQARDAILVRDMDDRIRFWNKGAERLYGWKAEEVLGRNALEILISRHNDEVEAAQHAVLERGEWNGELRHQTRDGQEIVVETRWSLMRDDSGRPTGKLVINTDVTEKKRLATQFLRAQRLESIGVLAAGIAHDFNNILTPMTMGVRLLKKDRSKEDQRRLLATLEASVERAAELVRQILAFAGGTEDNRGPVSLALVIREVQALLRHTLMQSVRLRVNVGTELWAVAGDNTSLSQVLMNLCVNARDAMRNGGDLVIEAENVNLDDTFVQTHAQAKAGPYVLVAVEDTGTGIPPHLLDRIFDPFFTTKGPGKGTGLGLATVLGIVKRHGGFVTVYSEVGKGTRFTVCVPAVSAPETRKAKWDRPASAHGGGETILVVDDESSFF